MLDLLSETPGDLIERITATLIDEDVADAGLFTDLLNTLYGNRCRASGFAPHQDTRKSVIPATRSALPNSELLPAYLADTPFLELFNVLVPFAIPRKAFQAHSAMFAPSEHGKTQTIQHLIVGFLNEPDPPAMFIMDSMGAMLPKIQRLAIFEGRLKDRLLVLEAKQYVDENTEKFLADARQFGLGLFLATQYAQQLPEGVRRAIYGNTSIKFIGPIEYADRVSLAREMNTTPEFIGAMRAYDRSHTEWAVHVRSSNFTPSAVKVTVPYGTLENEPMMDDEAYQRVGNRASAPTKEEPAPNPPVVETVPVEGEPWAIKPGQEW